MDYIYLSYNHEVIVAQFDKVKHTFVFNAKTRINFKTFDKRPIENWKKVSFKKSIMVDKSYKSIFL